MHYLSIVKVKNGIQNFNLKCVYVPLRKKAFIFKYLRNKVSFWFMTYFPWYQYDDVIIFCYHIVHSYVTPFEE
jgi:hypothetical protein